MSVDSCFDCFLPFVGVSTVASRALGAAVEMLVVFLILRRYLALNRSTDCVVCEYQGSSPHEPRRDAAVSGGVGFACG